MKFVSFVGVLLAFLAGAKCANILGVFHVAGRSHYMSCSTLMKILAAKGHNVTVIAPFAEKNPPKNYRQIHLDGIVEEMSKNKFDAFEKKKPYSLIMPFVFQLVSNTLTEKALNHTKFKEFMKTKDTYDVVIMEEFQSAPFKYVAHYFNAPLIVYSALEVNDWTGPYQGNPDTPSYIPNFYLTHLTHHMSFFERLENSLFYVFSKLYFHFITQPSQNSLLHKYHPDAPDLKDLVYNVSLVLLNSDPSVFEPIPKVPSLKDVGGFHIKKPKPLPEDLQSVLDNAKHGVVYFSLGSGIKSKDMPVKMRDLILRKFSKMKETIIWKFEDPNLPGKPDNVIISNWLPQNDIFAHKNVKLFISHGGLFSTMEAVYYGLPVFAVSVLPEQSANARRAEANGFARHIHISELTEDFFSDTLDELLRNPKYKKNAEMRSKIMRDKPMEPAEAVNYWVEYVIRHKGAPHLRVASLDLEWYQYLLIDVVLFILAMLIIFIIAVRSLYKRFLKKDKIKEKKN